MPTIVVEVMPKAEILDPQGKAVGNALARLGKADLTNVRIGKRFEVTVDGPVDDAKLAEVREHRRRRLLERGHRGRRVRHRRRRRARRRCASASSPSPARSTTATPSARSVSPAPTPSPSGTATTTCRASTRSCCPAGSRYGDYLRAGAIAAKAPIMAEVIDAAGKGMPVLGICNGFQMLAEARLVPGAHTRNAHQQFIRRDQKLRVENAATAWTSGFSAQQEITIPLKNADGRFVADADDDQAHRGQRPGRVPLRRREPERLDRRHRRRLERARQRRRPDAAPRARDRARLRPGHPRGDGLAAPTASPSSPP